MLRLFSFILFLTTFGWVFAWVMSGRNQRRTVMAIGKILAVLAIVLTLVGILLTI